MRIDPDTCRDPDLLAAEVRRLRTVIAASDFPGPENASQQESLTDAERKALLTVRDIYASHDDDDSCADIASAIDGLLARLK